MIGHGDVLMVAGAKPAARESGPRETGAATRAEGPSRAGAKSPSEDEGGFAAAVDAEDAPASDGAKPAPADAAATQATSAPEAAPAAPRATAAAGSPQAAVSLVGAEIDSPAPLQQPRGEAAAIPAPNAAQPAPLADLPEGVTVAPVKAAPTEARALAVAQAAAAEPELASPEAAKSAPAPLAAEEAAPAPTRAPAPVPAPAQPPAALSQTPAKGDATAVPTPAAEAPSAAAPAPRLANESPKAAASSISAAQTAGGSQVSAGVAPAPFDAAIGAAPLNEEAETAPRRAVDAAPERVGPKDSKVVLASQAAPGAERSSPAADFASPSAEPDFAASATEARAGLRAEPTVAAAPPSAGSGAERVAAQVAGHIASAADGRGERLELRLDPPELGRVRLSFTMTDAGVTAVVSADRPDVLDFLRRHGDLLERELMAAGYRDVSLDFGQGNEGRGDGSERESAESPAATQRTPETGQARWLTRVAGEDRLDIRI